MLRNYFTVAVRNLLRNKVYSAINILGLAIGMACCLLIILFVQEQFSYDRGFENSDRIYRVIRETRTKDTGPRYTSNTLGQLGPALQREFPEIERTARLYVRWNLVSYGDKGFMQYVCLVDPGFLDFFEYRLKGGDATRVLSQPYSVVITEAMAKKLFGDEDPVGKVISVAERGFEFDYTITGVIEVPSHSHLGERVDFLTTTVPAIPDVRRYWEDWLVDPALRRYTQTYLLLGDGRDPAELERKLPDFIDRHFDKGAGKRMAYFLQPLTRIHLYTQGDYRFEWRRGDIRQIYLLSAVAFFILVIACINFMNLATARSTTRAKEVGMRKAVGAHRFQLMRQFLGESFLLSFLALFISIGIVMLALPSFNALVGQQLVNASATEIVPLSISLTGSTVFSLFGVALVVGVLAGSYPAFFLSAFEPVQVLKGNLRRGSLGRWIRKGLVVFQFSISLVGIIGSLVVYHQMEYVQNKDLGFDKEQVVALYLLRHAPAWRPRYQTVKQAFLQNPNVLNATAHQNILGRIRGDTQVRPLEGNGEKWQMNSVSIDGDFLDMFDLELVLGKNISKDNTGDGALEVILNETAVNQLGWADPIGKQIEWGTRRLRGTVVGVVKDFHFASVRSRIAPLVLYSRENNFNYISLKVRANNIPETVAFIETTWKQFLSKRPFKFVFLDSEIDRIYRSEIKLREIFKMFFVLSIFIASLGLFALAAFTAEQRKKEIGVRKVLGASVPDVVYLFSKDFVKLVLVANLIAWPVAYYAMNEWLQGFAYRIELGVWHFLFGGVIILAVALATVSFQAFKAATAHPIDSLGCE